MKKVTIAICDIQDTYRRRLAEYFIRKKGEQLQVVTFSGKRVFLEKEKEHPVDIVLLGKGFEDIWNEAYLEKELGEEAPLSIFLRETPTPKEGQERSIFKYQSAEEIFREIFQYYLKLEKVNPYISTGEKEIIGVYSPTHSRLQTPFTLTLAQILAADRKVLYVNLGEWAGFAPWMEEEYQWDLSDLLYLLSDHGRQTQGILESVLHTINRVDYIPPMADAGLLCQTTAQDYQELMALLVEKTDYQVIFLDFGIMVPGFFSLLEQCTSVYGVIDRGTIARGQWQQFEASIMKSGRSNLAEKIEYVSFSTADSQIMEQEPVLHQWLYGELGDRARAIRYRSSGAN